jgi:hypothetical protein
MARPKEKNRPPGVENPATVAAARGAFGCPDLRGSRQTETYRTGGIVATVLRECRNDDGHFCGLEVAR